MLCVEVRWLQPKAFFVVFIYGNQFSLIENSTV